MTNDCTDVDELLLQMGDYTNDFASVGAEKLFRKCSTSWEASQYLQDRVHDPWLPNSARQQLRRIIKRIQVQIHQSREYGWGVWAAVTLEKPSARVVWSIFQRNSY
jgi:hypothetical protein